MRASLIGLPTELRLKIFSYLVEPARFHIDEKDQSQNARKWKFTFLRPCHTPDLTHPSLCARPCFSGVSPPEALCHNKTKSKSNRGAIRMVCRVIYEESRGILDKRWIGLTVVQRTHEASSVLSSMSTQQLEMLVDLTIQVLPAVIGSDYCGLGPPLFISGAITQLCRIYVQWLFKFLNAFAIFPRVDAIRTAISTLKLNGAGNGLC
jgi:hypothetical protein